MILLAIVLLDLDREPKRKADHAENADECIC
jgi:hypothetical protein